MIIQLKYAVEVFYIFVWTCKQMPMENHQDTLYLKKFGKSLSMKKHHFETDAIRIQAKRSSFKEHSVPVYETSSFIFDSAEEARAVFADELAGYLYGRFNNPNSDEFISKLCALEGTESGVATSTGMAAVFLAIAGKLSAGDHLIASRHLFGTTHLLIENILPRWGISHTYADLGNKTELENSVLPTSRMIYAETPSNPGLDIIDLEWVGKFAMKNNLYFTLDNCFATPYLQKPKKFGVDFIIHSTTKFIDGQGRTLGGAVVGPSKYMKDIIQLARITGPVMSPHTAWLLSKSLETLAVRMDRHCSNALALARALENHIEIKRVIYPYLKSHPAYSLARKQMSQGGALVSLEIKGSMKKTMKFIDELKMISISSNLGDSRTTITHPVTTTHSKMMPEERKKAGISDTMVRISVGLEHIDDIVHDIEQALKKSV